MKKWTWLWMSLPLLLLAAWPFSANAEECVKPKDCYSQECAGKPSYPTFEFEACLTSCNATYWDRMNAYDTCVANQQTQQNMQQAQNQQPSQQNNYSEPATITSGDQNSSGLTDEVRTVVNLKAGSYVKSKPGQRVTVPIPEGKIVLDENSSIQMLKDGWKLIKGKIRLIINKLENRRFQTRTPEAVAAVRGTKFFMERIGSKTIIRVQEGVVDVTDKKGKNKVEVKAGFQTTVKSNKKPSTPQLFDAGSLDKWYEGNPNE